MPPKFAIYCRVSTEEQTTENQRLILVEYAERRGFNYEVFEEVESTRNTRPLKQKLLGRLRAMEFDGLLVLKLDRWARSLRELTLELEEIHAKGVTFISLNDSIDMSSATGMLQFQILSAFAEFERNLISERTKEGLARARSQGKRLGRPPGSKDKKPRKRRRNDR